MTLRQTSGHLDSLKELEVEQGEDGERDEGHPHEVGDEDVVPRVGEAQSHLRGADPGQVVYGLFHGKEAQAKEQIDAADQDRDKG